VSAVRWLLALVMLAGLGTAASGAEVAIPPSPSHWATDTAGFLKPQTVASLDARLRAYESSTGHQVLVYVAPTTGTTPTEDWTVRAFQRWKVGRKGLDDGLVLFVFPTDRKVRVEVGYGLEQTVPDATAARIIRDITPLLKAGRPDDAVTTGVDEILGAIAGQASTGGAARTGGVGAAGKNDDPPSGGAPPDPVPSGASPRSFNFGEIFGETVGILIAIAIVVLIIWLISKLPDPPKGTYISSSVGWDLAGMLIGGVVSGVSGGGFSGGGGLSGGGGATGSW
jgi:uncharacterized protein